MPKLYRNYQANVSLQDGTLERPKKGTVGLSHNDVVKLSGKKTENVRLVVALHSFFISKKVKRNLSQT